MSIKERLVLTEIRNYWNEAQEIEAEFEDIEIIQQERALIQLDEKYAKRIVEKLGV